ncbi:ecotin [Acinetobacter calcoaceticus]|uniref:Ecotin n=1 Tax=Acinetobacter calcoaceticus TaxID=471 RepID=A0A4R1XVG9_ACICA|nr:ecotin [Acinetobacter calcoaceticus]
MKKILISTAILSVLAINMTHAATASDSKKLKDVAPYPIATKDSNRNVIWLAPQKDEALYKVEIVATKSGMKDCNNIWFGANLTEKPLEGWGYNYYNITEVKGPMSTQRGCMNNSKTKTNLPIQLGDKSIVRYNSKLPIVVYAPNDVTISYRIWSAPQVTQSATIVNQ